MRPGLLLTLPEPCAYCGEQWGCLCAKRAIGVEQHYGWLRSASVLWLALNKPDGLSRLERRIAYVKALEDIPGGVLISLEARANRVFAEIPLTAGEFNEP